MRSMNKPRRGYRLGKRAERVEHTRRTILEATIAAHDELGISGASLRDIAERAGVAPSTILQHFPDRDELIRACGELSDALLPMPTSAAFADTEDELERVTRMAAALFAWWDALGHGFDRLRTDRRALPAVDAWFEEVDRRHRELAQTALPGADPDRVVMLVALTTPDAWNALRASGLDTVLPGAQWRSSSGIRPADAFNERGTTQMDPFVAFKYLHIASMFFAVALAVSGELVLRAVANSGEVVAIRTVTARVRPLANISTALFLAGVAFGIVAALTGQIDLLATWLILAYVAFLGAMALGITDQRPVGRPARASGG